MVGRYNILYHAILYRCIRVSADCLIASNPFINPSKPKKIDKTKITALCHLINSCCPLPQLPHLLSSLTHSTTLFTQLTQFT